MSTLSYAAVTSRASGVVLLVVLAIISSHVLGQPREDRPLWETIIPPERPPRPDEVISAEVVRIDTTRLVSGANSRFSMRMPDGATLVIVKTREARMPNAGFVWHGQIEGDTRSNVTLSVIGDVMVGTVSSSRGPLYRVRYWQAGLHLVEQVDPNRYPAELQPTPERAQARSLESDTCATDNGQLIDVLVVYTGAALTAAGNTAAMNATVNEAVEQANQSYLDSGVLQQLRLVHATEVDYTESGNTETDRNALQAGTGTLATVHALRDQYAADAVVMITESGECGYTWIMEGVANAFEDKAFAVVRRICGTDLYSFAHELGHIMSARHDWFADDVDQKPYSYNHGYAQAHPTNANEVPWRTIMALNIGCQFERNTANLPVSCKRLLRWSNPNLQWSGDATGTQQADNSRTLNNTALTVANFRCSLSADVWMRDSWSDTGGEPDPNQASQQMWQSPSIWVRNAPDPDRLHQHEHQNPQRGQAQYIYVKLHNRGVPASGALEVYGANAATGLSWPGNWTLLGSAPTAIPALASTIVEIPWTPADNGHYCLLARWVSAQDPMKTPEGPDINANVRANNNLIWRNVNVVDLVSDTQSTASFIVRNVYDAPTQFQLSIGRTASRSGAPTDFVKVQLQLSPELRQLWHEDGSGFRRGASNKLLIESGGAVLDGFVLPPRFEAPVLINFERPRRNYRPDAFEVRVVQSAVSGEHATVVGGVTYDVRANWLGR